MILTDTLLKIQDIMTNSHIQKEIIDEMGNKFHFSPKEKKDIKDLITYLTLNNIWTVEDLKK